MDRMFAKFGGAEVLRKAVSGMLPKNKLRNVRLARLKAYDELGHPYSKNILKMYGGGGKVGRLAGQLEEVKKAEEKGEGGTPVMDAVVELKKVDAAP